jgi:hypothetical protein
MVPEAESQATNPGALWNACATFGQVLFQRQAGDRKLVWSITATASGDAPDSQSQHPKNGQRERAGLRDSEGEREVADVRHIAASSDQSTDTPARQRFPRLVTGEKPGELEVAANAEYGQPVARVRQEHDARAEIGAEREEKGSDVAVTSGLSVVRKKGADSGLFVESSL